MRRVSVFSEKLITGFVSISISDKKTSPTSEGEREQIRCVETCIGAMPVPAHGRHRPTRGDLQKRRDKLFLTFYG